MSQLPSVPEPINRLDRERLQAVINNMTEGVLTLDSSCLVTMSNAVALGILDVNDALGKHVDDILHLTDKAGKPVHLAPLIQTQQLGSDKRHLASRDWQLRYADGTTAYIYISVAPVQSAFGQAQYGGYVLLIQDITRDKSLEIERSEFISVASHELRTPVAVAEGYISNALLAAEKEHTPDTIKNALQSAHDQILFLSNMLNDLSTLSRAEQGDLAASMEEFDVNELIDSLLQDFRQQALQKKISFGYVGQKNLGRLASSRLYVHEILQNFITNAIKYTEKGGITLRAKRVEDGVEFSVTDTGIGIGRNEHSKISEKFFRSTDWRVRKINGTGLGLYIAAKLAKLLSGQVSFDSELNKGSTFKLSVPGAATS